MRIKEVRINGFCRIACFPFEPGQRKFSILAGFLVPQEDEDAFHRFLEETGYPFIDETENVACIEFLSAPVTAQGQLKAAI